MIKTLLKIASVFVVLLIVTVAGFLYFFNANDYKQEIADVAEVLTGRKISIAGDLDVSLEYPWLGIKADDITIENPPGFGKKSFATIDRIDVSLKIIPLLLNRLDIDRLVMHQLNADLVRKSSGENNWAGLVDEPVFGFGGFSVGAIELKDSNLTWSDVSSGKQYKVLKIGVVASAVDSGQPLPVEIKAYIKSRQPEGEFYDGKK
jgi:uncharacterized protein involved in outer membrane biogenesis